MKEFDHTELLQDTIGQNLDLNDRVTLGETDLIIQDNLIDNKLEESPINYEIEEHYKKIKEIQDFSIE